MATIADCTCYCDCRMCPQSGDFHQHEDEPCPEHPGAVDETGAAPFGPGLTAYAAALVDAVVDTSFRDEISRR